MDIASRQFRILVVDDSAVSRKLVEYSRSGGRYNLLFAKNGRDALALMAEHQPAVVVTDSVRPSTRKGKLLLRSGC
jgi:CheY-like chemotaxis protein